MSDFFKLLQKYDIPGPRYTSYPTVPAWTESVDETDFREHLKSLRADEPLSLYFHIPFCENLCHFCGCTTFITPRRERSAPYVETLLREIREVASLLPKKPKVIQLHFGGGSPNFLQPGEIQKIMEEVRRQFTFTLDAEIAIEMHPRTSSTQFCEKVAALGFNRISLGIQDMDPKVQKLINRNQTDEMTAACVQELRNLGLRAFNFDLVYGLPGQSMAGWEKTLSQVLERHPQRLAVYSYAHIPWLKPYQRSFEDHDLPSPEMKLRLFERAYETLTQNGYRLIGMDHFAEESDELAQALTTRTIHRNFMGYSTRAEAHQIGFGVSAISYVGGDYFQNLKELPAYEEALRQGNLATFRGFLLGPDDKIRRSLINRFLCQGRIEIPKFGQDWKINFAKYFARELPRLQEFAEDGLLTVQPEKIQVRGEGFLFLRNMAMVFDPYLEGIREGAKNPVFSRTV